MDLKLAATAASKYIIGLIAVGVLLFIPAGTLGYWNAWLFIALLFIPMLLLGAVLLKKSPELLKKRMNADEREKDQKLIIALSAVMFTAGFVAAGLDFRFGWSRVPTWLILLASVIFLTAYAMYCEVMRENAFLSRTVEIQDNQTVVDTGLYGVVRHPMYTATILLYLAVPIILGSLYSFLIFLPLPILIVRRIKGEEAVLEKGLNGYVDYKKRVRYRLLPYIW